MRRIGRSMGLAIALAAVGPAFASPARAAADEQHQPRVPMADARAKALALFPGTIVSEELEKEGGRWIYSFEIKPRGEKRKIVREVNVDADTGAVVSTGIEKE